MNIEIVVERRNLVVMSVDVTSQPHVDLAEVELVTVLQALGDPARLAIVRALADRSEVACGAFNLGLARSTMSHHLTVLREAGLLEQVALGTARLNRLRQAEVDARFPGLLASVVGAAS